MTGNSSVYLGAVVQPTTVPHIQNMVCRIIYNICKYDNITTHLASLHWLKVGDKIHYKIAIIMFKCHQGTAPKYLMDLILQTCTLRQLRSSTSQDLVPAFLKSCYGCKSAFPAVTPEIWNALPTTIRVASLMNEFKT